MRKILAVWLVLILAAFSALVAYERASAQGGMLLLKSGAGGGSTPTNPCTSSVTWNPSDKSANATLSGGNLTITNVASGWNSARATASNTTGKFYNEYTVGTVVAATNPGVGFANTSEALGIYPGASTESVGFLNDGRILQNSVTITTVASFVATNNLGVAVDLGARKLWVRVGATGNWNNDVIGNQNPATGTGGASYSAFLVSSTTFPFVGPQDNTSAFTVNFGATPFAGTVPSGFTCW